MKKIILPLVAVISASSLFAQEEQPIISPSACVYMDAGAFSGENNVLKGGLGVTDARFGFTFKHQSLSGKINVNFAYNKVGIGDMYVDKKFSETTFIRGGYFFHQFGLQNTYGPAMKVNMDGPTTDAFGYGRQVGVMVVHSPSKYLLSASISTDKSTIFTNPQEQKGRQGYGAIARALFIPTNSESQTLHFGASAAFEDVTNTEAFSIGPKWPTFLGRLNAITAGIPASKNAFKLTPELLYINGKFALESQYYYNSIARQDNLDPYKSSGAYAMVRFLAKGDSYKYSHPNGNIANIAPKNLELVFGLSTINLSDEKVTAKDFSYTDVFLNLNYNISKNFIWRNRVSYDMVKNSTPLTGKDINSFGFTTRLIFLF